MILALEQYSLPDTKHDVLYQDIKAECGDSGSQVKVEIVEVNSPTVPSGEYVGGAPDGGGRIGFKRWRTLYGGHSFKEAWLWLFRQSRILHSYMGLNLRSQNPVCSPVGWRAVAEVSDSKRTALDQLFSDVFPICLTRDVVFIFLVGAAARLLTLYGCGWDWLLILLTCCFTYHTTSMNRFRQRNRDSITRDLAATRTTEHAEWVNHVLERLWPVYEPLIAEEMIPRADKILNSIRPSCLDFLHLSELTFGMKSLHVLQVKTYPDTADDEVLMDWKIHFMPSSTPHRKHRGGARARRMNSRIVLAAGIAGFETPILVEDVSLVGWLRVRMKLEQESSSIKTLEMSFVEKPELKYALKPAGGDTFGFDIASLHIPGLSSFLQAKVHLALSSMYLPNWLSLDVETLLLDKRTDAIFSILLSTFFPDLASRTRHRDP